MAIITLFEFVILIFSIVLHEVSHGYMANYLGDPTAKYAGRLTLNPIKHVDPFGSIVLPILSFITGGFIIGWAKPVPYNPYNLRNGKTGEALVALAGPLSNLAIALIFSFVIRLGQNLLPSSFVLIAGFVVYINLTLMLFNLIPVFPLDGSRILFSFLPVRFRYIKDWFEKYSLFFLLILIFFFLQPFSHLVDALFNFFVP
ncbi:MAG: site-2 protease family protein [Candidatus Pacebacteria bacterium]|nr:site-2 protease family protein [Candidatus Paceibacterota bacterium]MDD5357280.1 site-2 protease family protein [Candidatus Paceibacterota bacterium]